MDEAHTTYVGVKISFRTFERNSLLYCSHLSGTHCQRLVIKPNGMSHCGGCLCNYHAIFRWNVNSCRRITNERDVRNTAPIRRGTSPSKRPLSANDRWRAYSFARERRTLPAAHPKCILASLCIVDFHPTPSSMHLRNNDNRRSTFFCLLWMYWKYQIVHNEAAVRYLGIEIVKSADTMYARDARDARDEMRLVCSYNIWNHTKTCNKSQNAYNERNQMKKKKIDRDEKRYGEMKIFWFYCRVPLMNFNRSRLSQQDKFN